MLIKEFAFAVIGALLVLANHKALRKTAYFVMAFIFALGIAGLGIYFINHASEETDQMMFFPMFSPVAALMLLWITRLAYKRIYNTMIIFHLHGLFPIKHEERYVTRQEKNITFILLVLSVVIPYLLFLIIL